MTKDGIIDIETLEEHMQSDLLHDRVGLTNGCFDLLHVGHVRYLKAAKNRVDILIVAINSDESVRSLKGEGRPVIPLDERMEVVAALESVDFVLSFSDRTCRKVIARLEPDLYIKGGDYDPETLPEWKTVQEIGGQVEFIPVTISRSSSQIIEEILSSHHI